MINNDFYFSLISNEILISFIGFLTTLVLTPVIVIFAWKYNLVYIPNHRTSHSRPTPAMGGIAVFGGLLIPVLFLARYHIHDFYTTFAGVVCIFMTGVLDDLITLSAKRKLMMVLLTTLLIVTVGDIRLYSLHEFLGIGELPYWLSVSLSVLVITYIINSINLIDGVDGNAAITGIAILIVFNLLFYKLGHYEIIGITLPVILTYLAFLIFNLWGKNYKIFMGDTGSLILGFVIAIVAIKFCNLNTIGKYQGRLYSPLTVFSLLIVPVFDQLHVFIKRILMGHSPFRPDRNHLHHTWIKLGFSHKVTSLIMLGYGLIFFAVNTYALISLPVGLHILVLVTMALVFWHTPEQILKRYPRHFVSIKYKNEKKKHLKDGTGGTDKLELERQLRRLAG